MSSAGPMIPSRRRRMAYCWLVALVLGPFFGAMTIWLIIGLNNLYFYGMNGFYPNAFLIQTILGYAALPPVVVSMAVLSARYIRTGAVSLPIALGVALAVTLSMAFAVTLLTGQGPNLAAILLLGAIATLVSCTLCWRLTKRWHSST